MRSKLVMLLGVLGAYVNIVVFGFEFAADNQKFELPLVNWLKNPSLYPGDPITEGFARFPTVFWAAVASASRWLDPQIVLFIAFVLTKILFFWALARLVAGAVADYRVVACIVGAIALSPILNNGTPLSDSDVLNAIQTHTSLGIALLLWVGCFLMEGRWVGAAIMLGLAAYINGLFVIFVAFAFAGFVLVDWQQHKREIILAAIVLVAIALPCLALSRGTFPSSYPKNYVDAILLRNPEHFTLRSHKLADLFRGSVMILLPAFMIPLASKIGILRDRRLELLAGFFLLPFLLGAFVGEFLPTPSLMRLHLLRSESFLLLYSILVAQIYGSRILLSPAIKSPAAIWLVGIPAVLWPFDGFVLPFVLLAGIVLTMYPQVSFERLCRHLAQSRIVRIVTVLVVLAGAIVEVKLLSGLSSPGLIAAFVAVVGFFAAYGVDLTTARADQRNFVVAVCALLVMVVMVGAVPSKSRLWNPVIPPNATEVNWREVQEWAKASTPQDTKFLVPPVPGGFRVFSERVSWGEWKDGSLLYTFPPLADEWLRRMRAIGIRLQSSELGGTSYQGMENDYKEQSWEHLLNVAREEKIDYIVQFRKVPYSIPPVFANERFAVYRVYPKL
jgi:hypothetical protein